MTTLFLIEAGFDYEGTRQLSCHQAVELAVQAAADEPCEGWDSLCVRAVAPGPGAGVVVARFRAEYTHGFPSYPDDGEGPPDGPEPDRVWRRVL